MFMSPPLTKTFYQGPLEKELLETLKRIKKTHDDIQYVSYAVAEPKFGKISRYHCNVQDFISATNLATSVFDMSWPFEVVVVGNGFWIDYDYHGCWNAHIPPEKPSTYRVPLPKDLLKET
jgi:hypothetical protein